MSNLRNSPLVSVLMTVYNREKYIGEAIESVLASSYQNWELIIVDDKSNDFSVTIAQSYAEQDPRIQLKVNRKNLGDYPNRNKAASYARGEYLKYVDADDMIYPFGLEQLVFYMEQFPEAGYGLCSLEQDKDKIYPFLLNPREAYERNYIERKSIFDKAPLSSIIRREVFENVGGFTGKRMLGDFEMWHLLSQRYSVVLMPHGMVWYREHEDQEMNLHRSNPIEPFKYLLLTKELLKDKSCPLQQDHIFTALKSTEKIEARSILSSAKHHSIKKAYELYQRSELNFFDIITKSLGK